MEHAPALYRFALRLTRDANEANDLVQDAYVRAFRAFDSFDGASPKAWLLRILKNVFINHYRRARRSPFDDMEDADIDRSANAAWMEQRGAEGNPARAAERAEDAATLDAVLREMPEEFRMVLLLTDMEGYAYREVAEILDCPLGTVMSRLYRARKFARERLTMRGYDGK